MSDGISFFGQVTGPASTTDWPETYQDGTPLEIPLGVHRLAAGSYSLQFKCLGSNPLGMSGGSYGHAFGMGLDGLALRKMTVDDPWSYMRDYQSSFSKIEAGKAQTATTNIDKMAAAVRGWAAAHGGRWPASLAEAGLQPPLDPWRQEYSYAAPGKCNPMAFDIWSRRGQSRQPGRMLGNWASPFVAAGHAVEGEAMAVSGLCAGCESRVLTDAMHVRGAPVSSAHFLQLNFSAAAPGTGVATLRFPLPTELAEVAVAEADVWVLFATSPYYSTVSIEALPAEGPMLQLSGFEEERGRDAAGRALRVPVDNRSIALRVRAVGGPQARYGLGVGFGVDAVVLAAVL